MSNETTYTATYSRATEEWIWDKDYEYGPQPGSPVYVLLTKIESNVGLTCDDFFTWLFMIQGMCSGAANTIMEWIVTQGISKDAVMSFAAWKGLWFGYLNTIDHCELVSNKEYNIIKAIRESK